MRNKWDIESGCVLDRLLHAAADGVIIVLRFDQSDGNIWFVVENVVGSLRFTPRNQLAANYDSASREEDLFTNLRLDIPTRLDHRGRDELSADIAFAEILFVHPSALTKLCATFAGSRSLNGTNEPAGTAARQDKDE